MAYKKEHRQSQVFRRHGSTKQKAKLIITSGAKRSRSINVPIISRANQSTRDNVSTQPLQSYQRCTEQDLLDNVDSRELTPSTADVEMVAASLPSTFQSSMIVSDGREHQEVPNRYIPPVAVMIRPLDEIVSATVSASQDTEKQSQSNLGSEIVEAIGRWNPPRAPANASPNPNDQLSSRSSSEERSQLERKRYQSEVDRLNEHRDNEDPNYIPVELDDNGCNRETTTEPTGHVSETEGYDSADERPGNDGTAAANRRRYRSPSPEPHAGGTFKKTRTLDSPRPKTWGKRFVKLNAEGRSKRQNILKDIYKKWKMPCNTAIPRDLWVHGDLNYGSLSKGLKKNEGPLAPEDWPNSILLAIRDLAYMTIDDPAAAVFALRDALTRQAQSIGGPQWLTSVEDVKLASNLVSSMLSKRSPGELQPSTTVSEDATLPRALEESHTMAAEPHTPTQARERRDSVYDNAQQADRQSPTPTTPTIASRSAASPTLPIKYDNDAAVPVPGSPSSVFMANTNTNIKDLASLADDDVYPIWLLIQDEVRMRKQGRKPATGSVVHAQRLIDLDDRDLQCFGAVDFDRLRGWVGNEWRRRVWLHGPGYKATNAIEIE